MTTIIDPTGTPEVVWRDPSTTVYSAAAAGSDASSATELTVFSKVNIVTITVGGSGRGVKMPAESEPGDLFELYRPSGSETYAVYDENDATILGSAGTILVLRKIPAGWYYQ